jgi:hypothetical protein
LTKTILMTISSQIEAKVLEVLGVAVVGELRA